ncbi:MAG: DUF4097 family beta strand repeat-containing protein [Candidatus Hodarchaeales archaeon]|jgi:DNA-directed RNA polymerase subunit RPC12/RpoP
MVAYSLIGMSIFCSNCGSEIESDAAFCQTCGFKTELKTKSSFPPSFKDQADTSFERPYSDTFAKQRPHDYKHVNPPKKGTNMKTVSLFIVIFGILALSLLGLSQLGNIFNFNLNAYSYIGERTFNSSTGNFSSISLDLEISSGEIEITTVASQKSPVEALAKVFALKEYENRISDANNIVESVIGDKMSLSFKEESSPFQIANEPFTYNLKISIVESYVYEFTAMTSSGDINIIADQIFLNKLDLTLSSGSINMDLIDSNITTDTVSLTTSSGAINLFIADNVFTGDTSWNLLTSSGPISLGIEQSSSPINSFTQTFNIEASSGVIDIGTNLHSSIGVIATGTSSSGSVQLFEEERTSYKSSNYDSSNYKFVFDLLVSSGLIILS